MKMPIDDRTLARDAALVRISRTRRWTLAGAAALTAGLAALASALLPGKSFGAGSRSTALSAAAGPALPAPADAAQLGVGGSGQAPQSVPAPQAAPQPAPQPATPQPAAPSGGSAAVSGGS